jgi:hypothetical protein
MMFKIRKGLNLQQFPKHPGLVRRFLQGDQVLNLMEGHHPLDPLLWPSILEDSKLSGVLRDWVIWIHDEFQLDPLRLAHQSCPYSSPWKQKEWGWGVRVHRRRQSSEIFGKLTHGQHQRTLMSQQIIAQSTFSILISLLFYVCN